MIKNFQVENATTVVSESSSPADLKNPATGRALAQKKLWVDDLYEFSGLMGYQTEKYGSKNLLKCQQKKLNLPKK